jgi:hypothetical protein
MTEELENNEFQPEAGEEKTNQMTLFPEPAAIIGVCQKSLSGNNNGNARFPWIHNREPVDFHLMIIWP